MFGTSLIAVALAIFAHSEPVPRSSYVLESLGSVPSGFVKSGSPAGETTLDLRIALAQGDIPSLEQELYAISTPSSARYGQYLTQEQV